ncbi:MAG: class I SAM-dependent methyltransferase [bacterium]
MSDYLMEHPLEAERLELKTRREKVLHQLRSLPLTPGMDVLDVGCGTGAVTRILAEKVFPGTVVGVDFSKERLRAAEQIAREAGVENVRYVTADVRTLELGEEQFDLVFSRCLFQYLPGKLGEDTLSAMKRRARAGGTICVADIDGNCLYRYPVDQEMGPILEAFLQELEKAGLDPYVGRKLYSMFHKAGFRDIQVDLLPYYLIPGAADSTTLSVWQMKIKILEKKLREAFPPASRAEQMCERFMTDLANEEILHYNLMFVVQGKV